MNETLTYADLQDAGNAQAQLVLYAIARHANWNTGRCWPGQDALATMAKCHVRTVRRYLDKLQADGLISIEERRDENGHRQSDLITLIGYQEWVTALRNGGKVDKPKEIKGYSLPDKLSGDLPDKTEGLPDKNGVPTGQQVSANKELSLNNQIELDARAREDSNFVFSSEVPPRLILRGDPMWRMWIDWVSVKWGSWFSDAFVKEGAMVVFSAAPSSTAKQPKLPPQDPDKYNALYQARTLTQRSKAMTGDAA
jgi:hypothetical protein